MTVNDEEAFHSVIILRFLDMLFLIGITLIGLLTLNVSFKIPVWSIVAGCIFCACFIVVLHEYFPNFIQSQLSLFKHAFSVEKWHGYYTHYLFELGFRRRNSVWYGDRASRRPICLGKQCLQTV